MSNKPTHGYEIQQFIQMSGMEQWTKIQSGSIYYALGKLEKEGNVSVLREEQTGTRRRKIYEITKKGRETLKKEMETELSIPIFPCGSAKFVTAPILDTLTEDQIRTIVEKHIKELKEQKQYWEVWQQKKAGENASSLIRLSFQMTIHSIEQQILWHQELLEHIAYYKEDAKQMGLFIKGFDSESCKEQKGTKSEDVSVAFLDQLKKSISDNPNQAIQDINEMIAALKK